MDRDALSKPLGVHTPLRDPMPILRDTDVELEIEAHASASLNLTHGRWEQCVRVQYRPVGTRRWTRFVLLPDGQTVGWLLRFAPRAARAHYAEQAAKR